MARKRPSTQKRQREYQKRQRELARAEKAAQKRERRQNRGVTGDLPSADSGEVALGSGDETADTGE